MVFSIDVLQKKEVEVIRALGPMEKFNQPEPYPFESILQGSEERLLAWSIENWHWSVYAGVIYVIAIFAAQKYMRHRSPMNLRPLLAAWSALLAVFSIGGTYRMLPELIYSLRYYSIYKSLCHPNIFEGVTGFWIIAFVLSKPYELGDTLFIVLRKQRLIFLHWYHHLTVLIYTTYSYSRHDAAARWGFAMNYFVHSVMYTYYALRAMRFRLPRWVSAIITALQIIQMVIGTSICAYLAYGRMNGYAKCQADDYSIFGGLAIYISYLILFANFFYRSYLAGSSKKDS